MTISTIFFIFLAAFVVAMIAAFLNFFSMSRKMFTAARNFDGAFGSMNKSFDNMKTGMGFHILFGGLTTLAGIGTFITGVIWIIQAIKG